MKYRVSDTHINFNLTAPAHRAARLLAIGRAVSAHNNDLSLHLASFVVSAGKAHIAWRVEMRQRHVLASKDLVTFLQMIVAVPGACLDRSSFTFIP